MSARLRELVLAAEGVGELNGDDVVRGHAEHPVCGDVLDLTWRLQDGVIRESAWRASGCPATLAVAAAAHAVLRGASPSQVPDRLRRRLAELGGLGPHERHAELMLLRALGVAP